MPGKYVMKAIEVGTINLKDGSICHMDPKHPTDNRARYARVPTQHDVDALTKAGLAELHTGRIPPLKGAKFQAEDSPRRTAGAPAPRDEAPIRGGPRQETDEEAERFANGDDDDGEGTGDPTAAPA